jgi:predicted nucleotidyltransferase
MATPALARAFKEFLKSLNSNGVEYLLIGGYAVGIYGHIRATNDLDVWVNVSPENAQDFSAADEHR